MSSSGRKIFLHLQHVIITDEQFNPLHILADAARINSEYAWRHCAVFLLRNMLEWRDQSSREQKIRFAKFCEKLIKYPCGYVLPVASVQTGIELKMIFDPFLPPAAAHRNWMLEFFLQIYSKDFVCCEIWYITKKVTKLSIYSTLTLLLGRKFVSSAKTIVWYDYLGNHGNKNTTRLTTCPNHFHHFLLAFHFLFPRIFPSPSIRFRFAVSHLRRGYDLSPSWPLPSTSSIRRRRNCSKPKRIDLFEFQSDKIWK